MARLFDNNDVMEISLMEWQSNDTGYGEDLSDKILKVNELPYNKVLDAYEVCDTNEYTNLAVCWESCKGEFSNDEDPEENRYARCRYDKKSVRFLAYMREKAIDSLMERYMYNEKANRCPAGRANQFNKMLRSFLEERMLNELEGNKTDWLHDTVEAMWQEFCEEEKEMKKWYAQDDDYALYEAVKNGNNFLILEEEYAGRHIVFDQNLDEDEVEEIVHKFEGIGLTKEDFQYGAEWEEGDFRKEFDPVYYTNLA